MAGLDEGSLTTGFSKKRIIGVILIAAILFSTFAFAVTIFSTIFNTQRLDPNDNFENAPEEDPILSKPPLPWDPEDLLNFFNELNQTPNFDFSEEELEDLAEEYQDMIDGSIDDIDLSLMAGLIGAFLFSDEEVFRIYDYTDITSIIGNLWKYQSFDEYTGTSWECTSPLSDYPLYSYSDYLSEHSGQDIFNISMPLSPDQEGFSSFIIPNLFPTPYIMQGGIKVPNIDSSETKLMKTGFNSTTLTLDFTSTGDVNMSYELFGADFPTVADLDSSAVDPDYAPTSIQNRFLQLPPDITTYINANPNFQNHYNILNGLINSDDSATVVASKIKTYLETNFEFGTEALNNDPPADDEDTVEWFCEHEEGVWSDFVSAFCAFARAFDLPCRYIDGYNSRYLEEVYDSEKGKNAIPIMYRNIYNWAEIYVPTATDGSGTWAQLDVCENISPYNGSVPGLGDFNISISTNFTEGDRGVGNVANISATLTSENSSVSNRVITFEDHSMDTVIGTPTTDANGTAWITVEINNSQTIGTHYISASYSSAINYTSYTVTGPDTNIDLNLTIVSPTTVNVSQDNTCQIQGYLEDPTTGKRVRYGTIQLFLFEKGSSTPIGGAISPEDGYVTTGDDGYIDETFTLDPGLPSGEYEIRAVFSGVWVFTLDDNPIPITAKSYPSINDTSNSLDINITEEKVYSVLFYMNDVEASDNTNPVVPRPSTLELKAKLLNETGGSVIGKNVSFYTSSDVFIGQNTTNSEGIARYYYDIGDSFPAGPNKIKAKFGKFQNSSYFILNAPISFSLNNFPNPNEISKFDSYSPYIFNIAGSLKDDQDNPIKHGYFAVTMLDGGTPTGYLTQEGGSLYSSATGNIDIDYSVIDSTPSKNYTIRVSFNGIFNYPGAEPYFDLSGNTNFSSTEDGYDDLRVYDPYNLTILFDINGTATKPFYDDDNLPERYNKGEVIQFAVEIFNESGPAYSYDVEFYDEDDGSSTPFHTYTFTGSESTPGFYEFNVDTGVEDWKAGVHHIRVTWGDFGIFNSTYVIINETADISATLSDSSIQRGVDGFTVSGTVSYNGQDLRGLEVGIYLFDSSYQDVSDNFNYALGYQQNITIDSNGNFYFAIDSIDMGLDQGQYTLRIDFNGTINLPGISLSDYMVHFSSSPLNLDLSAGTEIIQQDYYTLKYEDQDQYWFEGDTLVVIGNLTWDNNTGISDVFINVTIKDASTGAIITSNNTVKTDQYGGFYVTLDIDDSWPDYRSETEIWVDFDPIYNGLDYILPSSTQFT